MTKRFSRGKIALALGVLLFALPAFSQKTYRVKSIAWERIEVTEALDPLVNPQVYQRIDPYKNKVDSVMSPPLGLSRVAMNAKRPESLLSNWVADVLVEGSTATGLQPADMGLINVGGLRNNMPEGIVRAGDIFHIAPFENKLVVVEMKGADLLDLMKDIASAKGEGVSQGVRMKITKDGELKNVTLHGEPIDPKRIYNVATIDYLAEGNDRMVSLKKGLKTHQIGILLRDVLSEYVIKHQVIDSQIEGRIVIE